MLSKLVLTLSLAGVVLSQVHAVGADAPAKFKAGDLSFTRPEKWEWVPTTSQMRQAELRVVDEKTKAKADIVFFAGFGGGVQANVDRWFGQFEEGRDKINAKMDTVTVGSTKVTYASAEGTYLSGMPGGPKTPQKGYALLGAIVQREGGDIFVRMTGPAELVKNSTAEFKKMIEGGLK